MANEVIAWDGALQQFGATAIRVGEEIIGTDFPFVLGYGYFVSMSAPDEVTFEGDPLTNTEYVPIPSGLDVISLVGSPEQKTSHSVFDELFPNGSEICRLNPQIQGYECAFQASGGVHGEEFPLEEGVGYFIRTAQTGYFPEDDGSPSLTIVAPTNGDEIHTKQPFVDIIFGDHQSGLDPGTFACFVNGEDKASFFTVDGFGASWQLEGAEELLEGVNVIDASVSDRLGQESNTVSTFDVVTAAPPVDGHFVNGYVFHGDTWEPLPGVAVTVESIPGVIYTDAEGHYVFPTPGLGEYRIDITKEHFTYAQRSLLIEDGWGDVFVDDAFLSPRDPVATRITSSGGVAINSDGSVVTSFPPGAVVGDIDVSAFNLDETEDLPADLPELSIFTYCVKFWPDAVEFADSAFVDQLNSRGFAEGTPIPVGHYSPEAMEWIDEGMAYVGADSSWFDFSLSHFMSTVDCNMPAPSGSPPGSDPDADDPGSESSDSGGGDDGGGGDDDGEDGEGTDGAGDDPEDEGCNDGEIRNSPTLGTVKSKFGNSVVTHNLPACFSVGEERTMSIAYASHTARPTMVVETGTVGMPSPPPVYTGVQVDVAGRRFTGILEASTDTTRQRIRFDGTQIDGGGLPTGIYFIKDNLSNFDNAEYTTASSFGGPPEDPTGVWTDFPVSSTATLLGEAIVDDRSQSELGSGWALDGLQRLYLRPDGDALITCGGGKSRSYQRVVDSTSPILDLIVSNNNRSSNFDYISVFLNDGQGVFNDRQEHEVRHEPRGIACADFNGDGANDVAVTARYSDTFHVFLNDGSGGFVFEQEYDASGGPSSIVSGDFNGDEYPDLAINRSSSTWIDIRFGDGQGSFGVNQPYEVQYTPTELVACHLNADDALDLAVATARFDFVCVFLGDGLGGFGPRQDYSVGDSPNGIAAGDFNGDEHLDLVTANNAGNDVSVLLNDGQGAFGASLDFAVGTSPIGVSVGEFNSDGVNDLVVAGFFGDITVYLGDGAGGLYGRQDWPIGGSFWDVAVADANSDGHMDFIAPNRANDDVRVFLGAGDASFIGTVYPAGERPTNILVADVDGDSFEGTSFLSKPGDHTSLEINSDGSGHTRNYPNGTTVLFDTEGLHTATIDRNGNTTTYAYDDLDRLETISYPGDLVATFTYDLDGLIESISDPAGRVTRFDHDLDGNLTAITNPDSAVTQYLYDDDHLLTEVTDPRDNSTVYEYDDNGYVTSIMGADETSVNSFVASDAYNTVNEAIAAGYGTPEDPAPMVLPEEIEDIFVNTKGDTTRALTDRFGNRTKKIKPSGVTYRYEYDENGNRTKVLRPDGTSFSYGWTEAGKLASRTDEQTGATTTYAYDPEFNRLTQRVNAVGDTTRHEYDDTGNRILTINALRDTTQNRYDDRGLLTTMVNAQNDSILFYYNAQGRIDSLKNELGFTTTLEYDLAGNRTAHEDHLGNRTESSYDDNGRLRISTDAIGRITEFIYDSGTGAAPCCGGSSGGLLTAMVNAFGDTTKYEYDEFGRRTKIINAMGYETAMTYDTEGHLTRVTDPEQRWAEYAFNTAGLLASVTDTLGRTTSYEYDDLRRVTKIIDSLSREIEYLYNDAGNLGWVLDEKGDTTSYAHDLLGRMTAETNPLGHTEYRSYDPLGRLDLFITPKGDTITYIYDEVGRLTSKEYPVGSISYQYDAAGRPTQIDDDDSRLVMTYDPAGRLVTLTTGNPGNPDDLQPVTTIANLYDEAGQRVAFVGPSSDTTRYSYDFLGRLDSLITPTGESFVFARNPLGRTTQVTRPNGAWTDYAYDDAGAVLSITHENGGGMLKSLAYTYDEVGLIETITDDSHLSAYTYDSLDRLTNVLQANPLLPDESYGYDLAGNRETSHVSTTYTYDDGNRITEDDQWTYTLDDNGRLVEKEDKVSLDRWEYDYDVENRTIAVRRYDGGMPPVAMEASYGYDGLGRRINCIVDDETTVYVYDGKNFVREYDGGGLETASYLNGPGIDQPLHVTRGGSHYYFHSDHQGSVRILTDDLGDVAQTYLYDGFGNIKDQLSQEDFSPYTYTGREWDGESDLYYYRARQSDASVGRFTSLDSFRSREHTNLYVYVGSSPTNRVDPLGRWYFQGALTGEAVAALGTGGGVAVMFDPVDMDVGIKGCWGVAAGVGIGAAGTVTAQSGNIDPGADASLGLNASVVNTFIGEVIGVAGNAGCSISAQGLFDAIGYIQECPDDMTGALEKAIGCEVGLGLAGGIAAGATAGAEGCAQFVW
ncbi:FG-GAP-like repeat-containing protein [Candidatus Eisenbacteria bacterium]|uniref:FG-GAP-like repeat-containing protein n=1 Tax=Eiseniibacteriota bacterium TaxID=2212470 RepID=A0ABV6YIU6_UNCEI